MPLVKHSKYFEIESTAILMEMRFVVDRIARMQFRISTFSDDKPLLLLPRIKHSRRTLHRNTHSNSLDHVCNAFRKMFFFPIFTSIWLIYLKN